MKHLLLGVVAILTFSCQKELSVDIHDNFNRAGCIAPTFQNDGRIVLSPSTPSARDGKIDMIPTSGKAPFKYSIDGGFTWKTGNDEMLRFENLKAGKYFLVLQDSNGCTSIVVERTI